MRKSTFVLAAMFVLLTAPASFAGVIDVILPSAPTIVIKPTGPSRTVTLVPAPPPAIVIAPGAPEYWFWDDAKAVWFYYDMDYKPHYVRSHVYVEDDRHFFVDGKEWKQCRHDNGKHRGWHKEKGHKHRKNKHGRRDD